MLLTIHHVAGSGGSIVSKAISAATNSILLSEINPFAAIRHQSIKPYFDPTAVLWHLTYNSEEISLDNKLHFFFAQLDIAINHSVNLSRNILLRDHTHSTYNFLCNEIYFNNKKVNSLFIEAIKNYDDTRNLKKYFPRIDPILSVRHPLDNFLSARKHNWLSTYCGIDESIDNYCKSLVNLQKYMSDIENAKILRYEDFCLDMKKTLLNLFNKKEKDFNIPTMDSINKIKVTGESGRKSEKIEFRSRLISEVDDSLINEINKSSYYKIFCKMNNYNPDYKDFPI